LMVEKRKIYQHILLSEAIEVLLRQTIYQYQFELLKMQMLTGTEYI